MATPKQPPPTAKISVECPHCGSKQMEPAMVQSANCRKCGKYFRPGHVQGDEAGKGTETSSSSLFIKRLTQFFTGEKSRTFNCFHCKGEQTVTSAAESTMCPHCGVYVDLRDHKIKGVYSRSIETQGTVVVTSRGDLTSTKVLCGNAIIQGKVHGTMICPGTIKVKYDGRITGAMDAARIVIEKGSSVEFVRPVKAELLEVAGKVSLRANAGKVKILKKGYLEGAVCAKAIEVDQGGILNGELEIGRQEPTQSELIPTSDPDPGSGTSTPGKPGEKFNVKEQKGLALKK